MNLRWIRFSPIWALSSSVINFLTILFCAVCAFPELKRQWEDFSHCYKSRPQSGGGRREPPFEFSVMSYNILSQDLLHDNNYLYKHCSSSILNWNHRLSNILKELKEHNADVSEWFMNHY